MVRLSRPRTFTVSARFPACIPGRLPSGEPRRGRGVRTALRRRSCRRSGDTSTSKTRDAIDPLPRPETEVKQRYKLLIARVALRTLHEIFSATPSEVIEAVIFNGRVSTIDRATGKPARPHLVSVSSPSGLSSKTWFWPQSTPPPAWYDSTRWSRLTHLTWRRWSRSSSSTSNGSASWTTWTVVSGLDGRKNLLEADADRIQSTWSRTCSWPWAPRPGTPSRPRTAGSRRGRRQQAPGLRRDLLHPGQTLHRRGRAGGGARANRCHGRPQCDHRRPGHHVLVRSRQ